MIFIPFLSYAQIGYQITLLNEATGMPRANETVTAEIEILDSKGNTIHSENQRAITNDYGVISLSVGGADTFEKADWQNLPFFISTQIEGIQVGLSQIPSVPVAEYAKVAGPTISIEHLCSKKWEMRMYEETSNTNNDYFLFTPDGYCQYFDFYRDKVDVYTGKYKVWGNSIFIYDENNPQSVRELTYIPFLDCIYDR